MYNEEETNYLFYNANWKKDTEEFNRKTNNMEECRYYCQCGHSVIIPYSRDTKECSWCHRMVKKDKRREFRDNMRRIKNEERREQYAKREQNNNEG